MATKTNQDFKAQDIVKTVDEHAKDLQGIEKRLSTLERKFGPENIVQTLNSNIKESTTISETIATILQKLLSSDDTTKTNINLIVEKIDRNQWKIFIGKSGTAIGIIIGFIIEALIKKIIG